MLERVVAACDGASKGNPGPAGWAWVVSEDAETAFRWEAGALGTATNNVAELTALERLLTATDPGVPLEVRMDSQYAMKAVTTWLPGWKRNGWKTAAGKPVANQELVVRIDALLDGRTVDFRYVPAHQVDGDPLNDFADRAASQAATAQTAAGTSLGSPEPPPSPTAPASAAPRRRSGGSGTKGTRTRTAGSGSARTIKAKFPGRCVCGRSYAAGESIAKNDQGWGHPECRTTAAAG
ncbi:ribonuclease H [Streptomyces sp. NPDC085995]|uniref:ribonuclease H family protein n=1 Tax=Streptomyces sp. NPDC085995 TaxID=3154861 RepID=UPI00341D519C